MVKKQLIHDVWSNPAVMQLVFVSTQTVSYMWEHIARGPSLMWLHVWTSSLYTLCWTDCSCIVCSSCVKEPLFFSALKRKKITVKTRGSTYRDRPGLVLPGETWRLPPPAVPSLSGGCRKCCSWIQIPRCPCPCCHTSARCCGSPRLEMWRENWCHYVWE